MPVWLNITVTCLIWRWWLKTTRIVLMGNGSSIFISQLKAILEVKTSMCINMYSQKVFAILSNLQTKLLRINLQSVNRHTESTGIKHLMDKQSQSRKHHCGLYYLGKWISHIYFIILIPDLLHGVSWKQVCKIPNRVSHKTHVAYWGNRYCRDIEPWVIWHGDMDKLLNVIEMYGTIRPQSKNGTSWSCDDRKGYLIKLIQVISTWMYQRLINLMNTSKLLQLLSYSWWGNDITQFPPRVLEGKPQV